MRQRLQVHITGIVQGVGFRPFIYHLAQRWQLSGWVLNDSSGVHLEIEGSDMDTAAFLAAVREEAPPLAVIESILAETVPCREEAAFVIRHSAQAAERTVWLSPDVATCADCQRELLTPSDRRYRYPFINCTNCGPRYSIIRDVPYDRAATTMAGFPLCPVCRAEYEDPANRRFHAQPNACDACGPQYTLQAPGQPDLSGADVWPAVRQRIAAGEIVAIKGIGGYHLACDARSEQAVTLLRRRKVREAKAFAVMCGSLAAVERICRVSAAEAALLTSSARPIVLLDKLPGGYDLAADVAPGNPQLGVMLPYAPPHWLLLAPEDVWVMTSGNTSEEPICYRDDDAWLRLAGLADAFFGHNRPIERAVDDSVARIINDKPYLIRRSRGYAPAPIKLARTLPPLLALGGELKNTFCLTRGQYAIMSSHMGDLTNLAALEAYQEAIAVGQRLFDCHPELVVHDWHPQYISTQYAASLALPTVAVQHHHAHIAAVAAEHQYQGPVLGVAFDGSGYGLDGTVWGGEFLLVEGMKMERLAHLAYLPLPGGDKAVREPWRLAVWLQQQLLGEAFVDAALPLSGARLPPYWQLMLQAAAAGVQTPLTSSAGRLFDAAAAMLGLCRENHYEGQAAIELEWAAKEEFGAVLPYDIHNTTPYVLDLQPAFAALLAGLQAAQPLPWLAASFHATLAAAVVELIGKLRRVAAVDTVALSGGVWQNRRLLTTVVRMLEQDGCRVLLHRQVPPNDGGLALGQAWLAGIMAK